MDTEQYDVYKFFNTIASIYLKMRKICENKLQRLNVTYPQFGVLSIVYANPNIIQKNVGELLHSDTTTIMVICDSLEKKGLVKRLPSKIDRRAKMLALTPSGETVVSKALPLLMEAYSAVLNINDEKKIADSLQTLNLIVENILQLELDTQKSNNPNELSANPAAKDRLHRKD